MEKENAPEGEQGGRGEGRGHAPLRGNLSGDVRGDTIRREGLHLAINNEVSN